MTFTDICTSVCNKIYNLELTEEVLDNNSVHCKYMHESYICQMYKKFKENGNSLPNPIANPCMGNKAPELFIDYPDLLDTFKDFCNENHHLLIVSSAQDYLISTDISALVADINENKDFGNANITIQNILSNYGLKSISICTVSRWMVDMGYKYCEQK
jgi:hypothetical protein